MSDPPRRSGRAYALVAAALVVAAIAVAAVVVGLRRVTVPTVAVVGVRVEAVRREGMVLRVDAEVDNRNAFAITVQSVDVAATLEGHAMGRPRVVAVPVRLPARASTRVALEVDTPWGEALSLAWSAASQERFRYRADGYVRVGSERLDVRVPLHVEGFLTRAEVLAVVRASVPSSVELPGGWVIELP